jgi:hypothetical protein
MVTEPLLVQNLIKHPNNEREKETPMYSKASADSDFSLTCQSFSTPPDSLWQYSPSSLGVENTSQ